MAVAGFKKKASKRQTTRHRKKVERKIREHNRKLRKVAKKTPNKQKLRRKDPGVPNSLPFKEDILNEAKRLRDIQEQEKLEAKQRKKEARAKLLDEKRKISLTGAKNLTELVNQAQVKAVSFEQNEDFVVTEKEKLGSSKAVENSLKAYYKEFRKVIDAADVILEVLDARDPLGSRCPQVEQAVISAGTSKKLVLVLNKIDLIPKENVEAWLKYLRNELPTVAFKSSTQSQNNNLARSNISISSASQGLMKSAICLGADVLLKLLANYSRNKDLKTAVRVGVVGFPNTGKSSLINSLKRSKACMVGNTPGVTKVMQQVQLDKNVTLLDSPGIIMATGDENSAHNILRNAVKVETIADPVSPVEIILSRCRKDQMIIQYKIPMYTDCNNFLMLLCKRFGMLRKGGLPDLNKAARLVLQDWNSGKITYYTQPPEQHSLPSHISSEIVSVMSKEFDIDALTRDEQDTMKDLRNHMPNAMLVDSYGFTEGATSQADESISDTESFSTMTEQEGCEEMDDDTISNKTTGSQKEKKVQKKIPLENVMVPTPNTKRKTRLSVALAARSPITPDDMQLNKARKKEFKKIKKQRKRADKVADDLNSAMEAGFGSFNDEH